MEWARWLPRLPLLPESGKTSAIEIVLLAKRIILSDKAAANGSGAGQTDFDYRRRTRRRRYSHFQRAQGGLYRLDGNRWRRGIAESAQRKAGFHYSGSHAAENARAGSLQSFEKRSCNAPDSDHDVNSQGRRDRSDSRLGIWRRRLCDKTV